ncbi:hypothetical protein BpHYR1_049665 [Brachionus plicatilis]|uniref:Uncharacterized protein n=1 Tax=Brachionus plicatilis TaxID=10195 RepID=A0A3M7R6B9_BRAPC|nr:hypothetical protein BpHYR1_049665 [Brachionus plicatilis]
MLNFQIIRKTTLGVLSFVRYSIFLHFVLFICTELHKTTKFNFYIGTLGPVYPISLLDVAEQLDLNCPCLKQQNDQLLKDGLHGIPNRI